MGVDFQFFPRSRGLTSILCGIIECFNTHHSTINSTEHQLGSNEVLAIISQDLSALGFKVESGKKKEEKIQIPVLFGRGNSKDKYFYADAVSDDGRIVVEVEAGRAVDNNQFLKDIFQACMMHQVEYLVIAVRSDYRGKNDFERIYAFLETMYISSRLVLPLEGIVLIGY